MGYGKDPIEPRHTDVHENPKGLELKMQKHREREKLGAYFRVTDKIRIWVPAGIDPQSRIDRFIEKMNNRIVNGMKIS